jgi:hypothetical protein
MNKNAIIGHTGFVGTNLAQQSHFGAWFNTANISEILGLDFDILVCAAAPGSMFVANREPHRDRAQIDALIKSLRGVRARHFVLISSIAVLDDFAGRHDESSKAFQEELAYGRHRRELEAFVEDTFESCLVVRLPALFGQGLRKNFIFDLLNPIPTMLTELKISNLSAILECRLFDKLQGLYTYDPSTGLMKLDRVALDRDPLRGRIEAAATTHGFAAAQFHNPETTYQFYNVNRLWGDIKVAIEAKLRHIHLCSEPLQAARIHRRLTGREMQQNDARLHHEDMRTRHAALWGQQGPYLEGGDAVLAQLAAFYASERRYAL